jgi:hypothetical protein
MPESQDVLGPVLGSSFPILLEEFSHLLLAARSSLAALRRSQFTPQHHKHKISSLLLLGWRDKKKYFYLLEGFVES